MPEIVQEIGAYAGLASVVGLAVLSALYFSQARDVKRLREWAGRAPERAEGPAPAVPGRAPGQAPGQPVPAPAQPRPGAPVVPGTPPAAASTGARPATAPAGGARPGAATPAARPGQPLPAAAGATPKPGGAVPVPAAASSETAAQGTPAAPGQNAATQGASKPQTASPTAPAQGAPDANSKGVTAGAQEAPAAKPGGPATPAGQRPHATPPVPTPARAASPPGPGRPGGTTRPPAAAPTTVIPPPGRPPWYRRLLANPLYVVLAVAGVLILGGAAAFGVTQLASDGDGESSSAKQRADGESGDEPQGGNGEGDAGNGADKVRKGGAIKPGNVTVAVLNGTTVPGLAATLADQVTAAGFKAGTIANFGPNQQLAESVVQYASGHEREAAAVSRKLGIGQREAATTDSQELAGDATVIVLAGGDKAP